MAVKGKEAGNEDLDLGIDFDSLDLEGSGGDLENDLLFDEKITDTKETPADKKDDKPKSGKEEPELDVTKEFDKLLKDTKSENPDSVAEAQDKKKATNTDKKDEDSSGSLTVAFAKMLQEQGLSDFNEEEYLETIKEKGEAAALVELLEKNAEAKTNTYKESFDDYSKEYVDYRNAGFTKEQATTIIGNKELINDITDDQVDENDQLQENIIRETSKLRGVSADEIDEQVQLLKDTDKLKDRSVNNLKVLKTYYNKLAEKEMADKQTAIKTEKDKDSEYLKSLKDNVYKSEEIIKDKKINEQTKDKIYNLITTPVKLDDGTVTNGIWAKRRENPQEFDKKLAYFLSTGVFDGNTKTLTTDARTKAIGKMKKELEGGRSFSAGDALINNESETIKNNVDAMKEFLDD
jgi:hypothetical protein